MNFGILCFVLLFALPMAAIIATLRPETMARVAEETGLGIVLFVAGLLLPRLIRRLLRRRERLPSAAVLARPDWPPSLTRHELEKHCMAWLRARGWDAALASDPVKDPDAIYVMATRGEVAVAVQCDRRGEELNPAAIRAFALSAAHLGAARTALLTLSRDKFPPPAEIAARQAGVMLLRVADLPQLDALAPAAG